MAKYNVSDFVCYRPAYPLIVLHTVIINDKVICLTSQTLCFCIRAFFINEERIRIAAVVSQYSPFTYMDIRESLSNLPRINRQPVNFQLA